MSLTLASYNIHRCYGRDGRYDPARIRQVLRELDAQIIALQEVELLHDAPGLLDFFCEDSPWKVIQGITLTRDSGHYGNALLTALPIHSLHRIDLSQPGREPRGALHLRLESETGLLELITTHLGLRPAERRSQIQQLLGVLENCSAPSNEADMMVLMGDLNEWFLWGRPLRWLHRHFPHSPAPATYPSCCPLLALDRIWVNPGQRLVETKAVSNRLTRVASDHLPLISRVE